MKRIDGGGDWFDRLLPNSLIIRLWGSVLLGGGLFLIVRGRVGYFSAITIVLGIPAGLGMLLYQRWSRPIGLILFAAWGVMAVAFIALAGGASRMNLALLFSAVGGTWSVLQWNDR
jgi:hypothetical protein